MRRVVLLVGAQLALAVIVMACGDSANPSVAVPSIGPLASATTGEDGGSTTTAGELSVEVDGQTFTATAEPDSCTVTGDTFFIFARNGDLVVTAQGSADAGSVSVMQGDETLYASASTDGQGQFEGRTITYTSEFVKGAGDQATNVGVGTATATCQ
jgi:hypothetical protein